MSDTPHSTPGPDFTAEEARIRLGTALSLLELAVQVLAKLPPQETALRREDRELYKYLLAGETALAWLVGQGAEDAPNALGESCALGDGIRIYEWTPEELERHFAAALADFREEAPE